MQWAGPLRAPLDSWLLGSGACALVFVNNTTVGYPTGNDELCQRRTVCAPLANGLRRESAEQTQDCPSQAGLSRHQCTPLCNNTNFVAAEKSIFPLEKSSRGERLPGAAHSSPAAPPLRLSAAGTWPGPVCFLLAPQPELAAELSFAFRCQHPCDSGSPGRAFAERSLG